MSCRPAQKIVLKIASRRRAAKLITDAAELLEREPVPSAGDDPSIARELRDIPDPCEVP